MASNRRHRWTGKMELKSPKRAMMDSHGTSRSISSHTSSTFEQIPRYARICRCPHPQQTTGHHQALRYDAQRNSLMRRLGSRLPHANAASTAARKNRPPGQRLWRSETPLGHHGPAHRPVLYQTLRCLLLASATLSGALSVAKIDAPQMLHQSPSLMPALGTRQHWLHLCIHRRQHCTRAGHT